MWIRPLSHCYKQLSPLTSHVVWPQVFLKLCILTLLHVRERRKISPGRKGVLLFRFTHFAEGQLGLTKERTSEFQMSPFTVIRSPSPLLSKSINALGVSVNVNNGHIFCWVKNFWLFCVSDHPLLKQLFLWDGAKNSAEAWFYAFISGLAAWGWEGGLHKPAPPAPFPQ